MENQGWWRCQDYGVSAEESYRRRGEPVQERDYRCWMQQKWRDREAEGHWSSNYSKHGPQMLNIGKKWLAFFLSGFQDFFDILSFFIFEMITFFLCH